jgi:hypothetical protein
MDEIFAKFLDENQDLQIFIDDISDHPAAIYYTTLSPSKC